MVSDAIYERITGEKGYFDTRIVFISESGPAIKRVKRLAIMDEDGANPIFLTPGSYMVLTPRFNPTAQMIAYMSYIGNKPRVYLFDIETGKQEMLGNFPNMTFSPRFSPDGNQVALTSGDRRQFRHLSDGSAHPRHEAADHRSGDRHRAQLLARWQADRVRIRPRRQPADLCHECGRLEPAPYQLWRGQQRHAGLEPPRRPFAFTKQDKGRFDIGVMRPDGAGERILTSGYHDEGPTWAPNGRVLMFTREASNNRGAQIWSVDVTGRNERHALTPGAASDPAWSPLIQ